MALKIFGKFDQILLEAEVAPASEKEFVTKYKKLTGNNPSQSSHYQIQDNKWGVECRIYFNAPKLVMENLKNFYHVENRVDEGYRTEYEYRINSHNLFWGLIEYGYRIGKNQPIPFSE